MRIGDLVKLNESQAEVGIIVDLSRSLETGQVENYLVLWSTGKRKSYKRKDLVVISSTKT